MANLTKEEKAILDVLAYAEGTLGISNNGYDVCFTRKTIVDWTEDTDIVHGLSDWIIRASGISSSAAGRYQFLGGTWTGSWVGGTKTKKGQNVPMTKDNQDIAGLWLINKRLKSTAIDNRTVTISELGTKSKFDIFLQKCAPEWASLPLTKDITWDGELKKAGRGFYSKTQNSKKTSDELFGIFNKALALY